MQGLAIRIIGIMTIALIGLAVLIIFLSGNLYDFSMGAFCFFYQSVTGQKLSMCEGETSLNIVDRKPLTRDELARDMAAFSIMCWKEATRQLGKQDIFCYQINLRANPGSVSELYMTSLLENEGGCDLIENSLVKNESGDEITYPGNCGLGDNIQWNVSGSVIENQSIITIRYNTLLDKIVIKA